jgi:ATP/maltotriose-dependent transcriptional regulator MalT
VGRVDLYFCLAQKLLALGDVAGARTTMEQADRAAGDPSVPAAYRAKHAVNHIVFALQQDELGDATEWGNRVSEYGSDALGSWLPSVLARLLIAQGKKEAARRMLPNLYEKAMRAGAQGYVIKVSVYRALAAETPTEALTFLSEALTLGEPEGFIRTFVDEGRLLKPLLRQALSHGITPEYSAKLLGIIEGEERRRRRASGAPVPIPETSEFLSRRELEVLQLVANGLSNGQIATELAVSLNTVKRHVHNIFEKLNTRDRLHAVTRARELRLT